MNLLQILRTLDPGFDPNTYKVHLAVWNGIEEPLNVFLEGRFDEWQTWQNKKNFQRENVLSLISLPEPNLWLFAGTHQSGSCIWSEQENLFCYDLKRREVTDALDGRLVVHFQRSGRQSYLRAEKWIREMTLWEVLPQRMAIAEFPGFSVALVSKADLDLVCGQGVASWKGALQSVAGVYLIVDRKTGKQYVGSAVGEGGIWSRWMAYAKSGHGGNAELKRLLKREGSGYAENFHFGILEIADRRASSEEVLSREKHWKDLLMSREFGMNLN